jgi:hypothetical protein
VTLLELAATLSETASRLSAEAGEPGNSAAGENIKASLQKLRHQSRLIADTLAQTRWQAQTV